MGLTEHVGEGPVYLDTNVFIYAFEGHEPYAEVLRPLMQHLDDGTATGVTSTLTLAELLVGPLRAGLDAQAATYRRYLRSRAHFTVAPVSRAVLVEAAQLRATTSLKLPDAIHVATARAWSCTTFLTNDARIARGDAGLPVVLLRDHVSSSG